MLYHHAPARSPTTHFPHEPKKMGPPCRWARRLRAVPQSKLCVRPAGVFDLRQTEELQHSDVHPADVQLEPAGRKLRGTRIRVVIVVQLFATEPDGDR